MYKKACGVCSLVLGRRAGHGCKTGATELLFDQVSRALGVRRSKSGAKAVALFTAFCAVATPSLTTAQSAGICSAANVDAYLSQQTRATKIDKETFFEEAKSEFSIYKKPGLHFEGTDAIIDAWNADPRLSDERWLAYILATAYHETAFRMFPVREGLASSDERAIEILSRSKCCSNKTYWRVDSTTGRGYFGRGYVQLTWDYNYQRADKRFGVESETYDAGSYYWEPDNALDPDSSIKITYDGMIYGWFTGHCLLRHFQPNKKGDWKNARRVINGLDRASDIGAQAQQFMGIIEKASISDEDLERRLAEQRAKEQAEQIARERALIEAAAQGVTARLEAQQELVLEQAALIQRYGELLDQQTQVIAVLTEEIAEKGEEIERIYEANADLNLRITSLEEDITLERGRFTQVLETLRDEIATQRTQLAASEERVRLLLVEADARAEAAAASAQQEAEAARQRTQELEGQLVGLEAEQERLRNRSVWESIFGGEE